MFTGFAEPNPTHSTLAAQALAEEQSLRFAGFSANEAVTIGLSLRKRFRASSRHARGKGLIISIQTTSLQPLFSCTVSPPAPPTLPLSPSHSPIQVPFTPSQDETSPLAWQTLTKMIDVVKNTHHSSFYVEKSLSALGRGAVEVGVVEGKVVGGAFPIWLDNISFGPVGIIAVYSGSSHDDHHLVTTTIKDYLNKLARNSLGTDYTHNPHGGRADSEAPPLHANPRDITYTFRDKEESSVRGGGSTRAAESVAPGLGDLAEGPED